jgi:hypothetical protein
MQFLDPLQFWEVFSMAMNENPPPEDEIKAVIPVFKYLGIELGRQWKRESVPLSSCNRCKSPRSKLAR